MSNRSLLTDDQANCIRYMYTTQAWDTIDVRPWVSLTETEAADIASILAPNTAGKAGTQITKIIRTQKGVSIQFRYVALSIDKVVDENGMATGAVVFQYGNIQDTNLWQYLIYRKFPVPLFIAPGHPCNQLSVLTLGLGVEVNS